jgi:environmental stress-induced protein Ves
VTVVRAADVAAVPWKNGGGVTRDLLADAEGDAWRWRLSLADIDRDGPFSAYPGVERWFAVVEGAGVTLAFAQRTVSLRGSDEPIRFDGADAPGCTLIEGRTRDLNLMLRGGARGVMSRRAEAVAGWPLAGCLHRGTMALHWAAALPSAPPGAALWIGVAP